MLHVALHGEIVTCKILIEPNEVGKICIVFNFVVWWIFTDLELPSNSTNEALAYI